MGVSGRWLKLLLLLTLVPLALRATSLLLGAGHDAPAPSHRRSPIGSRRSGGDASAAAVSAAGSANGRPYPYTKTTRHLRRIESSLAAIHGARRLRHADADDGGSGWFEDDKRLAPTGSNPLHNLR